MLNTEELNEYIKQISKEFWEKHEYTLLNFDRYNRFLKSKINTYKDSKWKEQRIL